jgi:5-methylcytosine-specific restriction endonuclease McrA
MEIKACTKCGELKSLKDFPNDRRLRSGLSSQCRSCHAVRSARYYSRHAQKVIAAARQWRETHPERFSNLQRRRYTKISSSEWADRRAANKTQVALNRRAASRSYYHRNELNRRKSAERVAAWRQSNPEAYRAHSQSSSQRRRARLMSVLSDLTREQWQRIKFIYRFRCAYCGERKPLTMDHVVPVSKGGHHTASNIVPACQSCNSRKSAGPPKTVFQPHLLA